MKNFLNENRGVTLIELITSIAVLSIVAVSSFTLLMFSIRTNTFIVTGSALSRDSDLLNDRLSLLLRDYKISVSDDEVFFFEATSFNETEQDVDHSAGRLLLEGEELVYYPDETKTDGQVLEDCVTRFHVTIVEESGTLLRIEYTLDDSYTCTKIFTCVSCISLTALTDEQKG